MGVGSTQEQLVFKTDGSRGHGFVTFSLLWTAWSSLVPRMSLLRGAWSHLALVQYDHPSLKSTGLKSSHTSLPQTLGVPQWASGKLYSLTVFYGPHLPDCFLWQRLHCGPCTMVLGSWAPSCLPALPGPCSQSLPDVFHLAPFQGLHP